MNEKIDESSGADKLNSSMMDIIDNATKEMEDEELKNIVSVQDHFAEKSINLVKQLFRQ